MPIETQNKIINLSKVTIYFLLFGFAGIIIIYFSLGWLTTTTPFGIRLFFDNYDINVYYKSSAWVAGGGKLYQEVYSEYLILANLIFGLLRFLAEIFQPLSNSKLSFIWLWMSASLCLYLWIIYQVYTKSSKILNLTLWIWLAPATFYFTLYRFDIYPAVITFLALFFLQKDKHYQGAFWLGIAIALKGYMLFVLPVYFIFLYSQKGWQEAVKIISLCLLPFLLSNFAVFAYSGWIEMMKPYVNQSNRFLNPESTYKALIYLSHFKLSWIDKIPNFRKITQLLQISTALIVVLLRPKTFEALVNSFLLCSFRFYVIFYLLFSAIFTMDCSYYLFL
jgi:hypothetical protein